MLSTETPKFRASPQAGRPALHLPSASFVDGIVKHLGQVVRERREQADVIAAEISARLKQEAGIKKTESALSRFERGETTPDYLDATIAAYAAELGTTAIELWAEALKRWREADPEPDQVEREVRATVDRATGSAGRGRARTSRAK